MDSIRFPTGDSLDLHTFDPREVKDLLHDYLDGARHKGLQEVLIIHGKGQGLLRKRVHQLLQTHAGVASFGDAEPGRGGWGATVVRLIPSDAGGEEGPEPVEPGEAGESGEPRETGELREPRETEETGTGQSASSGGRSADPPPHTLHHLHRSALAAALLLGLGLGALFYHVLLHFGARPVPSFIPLYGVAGFYGLVRRAASLRQVLLRALTASAVLGVVWLVSVAVQH
jgi:hypothetical protein